MSDAPIEPRILGVAAMKALGHPIRTRLFNELAAFGPSTATTLAQRIGESSGSTSYHLRQLARHGIVEEAPDLGVGRERYWRRAPGPLRIGGPETADTPAVRTASAMAALGLQDATSDLIRNAMASMPAMPDEWHRAADFSTFWFRLTAEQLAEVGERLHELVESYRTDDRSDAEVDPRARRVLININLTPVFEDEEDDA